LKWVLADHRVNVRDHKTEKGTGDEEDEILGIIENWE
jgi:hypothetical protein